MYAISVALKAQNGTEDVRAAELGTALRRNRFFRPPQKHRQEKTLICPIKFLNFQKLTLTEIANGAEKKIKVTKLVRGKGSEYGLQHR